MRCFDDETRTEPDYQECASVNPGSARIIVPQDEWLQMRERVGSLERAVAELKDELETLGGSRPRTLRLLDRRRRVRAREEAGMSYEPTEQERWDAYLDTMLSDKPVIAPPPSPRADPLMDSVRGSPRLPVWGFASGAIGGMLTWALMALLGC